MSPLEVIRREATGESEEMGVEEHPIRENQWGFNFWDENFPSKICHKLTMLGTFNITFKLFHDEHINREVNQWKKVPMEQVVREITSRAQHREIECRKPKEVTAWRQYGTKI